MAGCRSIGLPITPDFEKDGRTVQWFERARFERNPQLPADQQVQLGLLGQRTPQGRSAARRAAQLATASSSRQTGHSIGGAFRTYWQAHGGLAAFGLPLTEEITENGRTVQWFERARFELNPQGGGTVKDVQLGQIGRTRWEQSNR